MSLFEHLRRRRRPLRALQVEVTSRCTRRCAICPRSALSKTWREGDMDEAIWKSLEPDLSLAGHVHLQGWGEPLLHPALSRWARSARRAGCTVGVTTNGDLLEPCMEWLEQGDLDSITVSAAGDARNHFALRDGSRLDQIMSAAGKLAKRFRIRGLKTKVQLSYLLTRRNAASLPVVVETAASTGLAEVFVTHLDCRPGKSFVDHSAFVGHNLHEEVVPFLDESEKMAKRLRIPFRGPTKEGEDVLTCALNPLRFAFVGWDGRVGPCVQLLLPIEGAIPRWSEAGEYRIERLSYGCLPDVRLSALLTSATWRRFTTPFCERLAAERRFLSALTLEAGAGALRELNEADEKREATLVRNPLPDACAGCPKANGW